MVGKYVMTENELLKKKPTPESIGMGSYTMDSHNVQRYVTPEGYVQNEGDIGVSTRGPYEIALGSILPQKKQCENLLVPVCVSSSHIAFGSIRMEPVFMILGQSAATVASMAINKDIAVQDVAYEKLKERLLKDGQVLSYEYTYTGKAGVDPSTLKGIVVDDTNARLSGDWGNSSSTGSWVGREYRHDGNKADGKSVATFEAKLKPGRYEVRLAYSHNGNRATNVPVVVRYSDGEKSTLINQRKVPPIDKLFVSLGEFDFSAETPAAVTISNKSTDGYVIIDAVQWLPK